MLKLPMKVGVRGEIRWFAYDENNNRISVKTGDGREVWGGWAQKNLITDLGLDAMSSQRAGWATSQAVTGTSFTSGLRQTLHVGTSSVAPAFADTALGNVVQGSTGTGGFTANASGTSATDFAGSPPTMTAFNRVNHVVTMTADRNLTEYGYSANNSAALNIRELFRDEFDTPITISLLSGTKLRVEHTWFTTFDLSRTTSDFTIESYDVGGALVATDIISAERGMSHVVDSSEPADGSSMLSAVSNTLVAQIGQTIGVFGFYPSADPVIPATFVQTGSAITTGITTATHALAWEGYVPGSYQRTMYITVTEPFGNMTLYGWRFGYGVGAFSRYGYTFDLCFRAGASFAKADTHTFRVGIVGTWSRL